ncbi:phage portal protein [Sphingomonas sp. RT2P30]|uniref:phage portal protein n=1 Tax=Parasphingomonas halimpatiens TaxID=3096162 RepID=UPI002FC85AA3
MKLFGMEISRARTADVEQRAIAITQDASYEQILAFFGLDPSKMPAVTSRSALRVPAVLSAVTFLSRTMATLSLGAFRSTADGPKELGGRLQTLVRDAPNPEWSSWNARAYFWQQVFLHGRGLFAILRQNGQPYELWPLNTSAVRVSMNVFGEKSYTVTVSTTQPVIKTFTAADIIDVPFMLAEDMCNVFSPVMLGEKAIQLALAMNDYGSAFFAGGGVPPLAMEGTIAGGKEAQQRAMADVSRAIDAARTSDKPIFPMPPGYKLTQVGYDPAKGQMTEARQFQLTEIARVFQMPPVFLQDLTHATFTNAEQQDLHLVKHLISQWATALEQEMNLKLFGQMNGRRYVRHDIDSLLRGDFKTRMDGLAAGVQNALLTPNEGRKSEGRPGLPGGDHLLIQGATVPLGSQPTVPTPTPTTIPTKGGAK